MLPNTYQEIYDTHTCLHFFKNMSKYVFILDIFKSRCKFITLWGARVYMQQNKVGWEVIFSELGFAGSGARKPRREFEALEPFFHVFLRLNGALIV